MTQNANAPMSGLAVYIPISQSYNACMTNIPNYYAILGITQSASSNEIKRAYRRRALELHPDVNPDSDATQRFKELNTAYQILSHPARRAMYDRMIRAMSNSNAPTPHQNPSVKFNAHEQLRLAFRDLTALTRTGIFWWIMSFCTFLTGMVIFQNGLDGVPYNLLLIVGSLIATGYLYKLAIRAAEGDAFAESIGFSNTLNAATGFLIIATLIGSITIIGIILNIVVLLEIIVPGVREKVMYSFPVMPAISAGWTIVSIFRRSSATSIQALRKEGLKVLQDR